MGFYVKKIFSVHVLTVKRLYKYQSYNEFSLDNLKKRRIWFSNPLRFNDPFDNRIAFDAPSLNEKQIEAMYEIDGERHKDPEEFDKIYVSDGCPP